MKSFKMITSGDYDDHRLCKRSTILIIWCFKREKSKWLLAALQTPGIRNLCITVESPLTSACWHTWPQNTNQMLISPFCLRSHALFFSLPMFLIASLLLFRVKSCKRLDAAGRGLWEFFTLHMFFFFCCWPWGERERRAGFVQDSSQKHLRRQPFQSIIIECSCWMSHSLLPSLFFCFCFEYIHISKSYGM